LDGAFFDLYCNRYPFSTFLGVPHMIKRAFHSAIVVVLLLCTSLTFAQPQWGQYGKDAQHTGAVTTGVQRLRQILWQTPVDLYPPYAGTDLFLHYASTLVSNKGTVLVTVRTGNPGGSWPPSGNTFRIDGRDHNTGELLWSENTDWIAPPYRWVPPCGSAIGPDNRLWTPGAGGTVYVRSSTESPVSPVAQYAFYGITSYQANPQIYNNDVRICTPITVDNAGNAYFGFWVTPNSVTGLKSGIARISKSGVGTYQSCDDLTGFTGNDICQNDSPAISNDGTKVYIATKMQQFQYTSQQLMVLELDSTTLQLVNSAAPYNPGGATPAFLTESSGTMMIGPDGDVYYGCLSDGNLPSRGFMMHFSADLQTQKTPGAFGWDDTASLVPSSAVPGYTGTSKYLILTKYNNYADEGIYGDGKNKIAVLDPNNTETYTVQYGSHFNPPNGTGPSYTTMKEILGVLGVTPNANRYSDGTFYDGFREWCINDAVVDVTGQAAIINSEDGHCYRWDFLTNKLVDDVLLAPPTGEAYTPTIASADGLAMAVNNAQLCVMWDGAGPATLSFSPATVAAGDSATATLKLAALASASGATIKLVSGNPKIHVPSQVVIPAGGDTATFTVSTDKSDTNLTGTIIATRYNVSLSTNAFRGWGTGPASITLNPNPISGGTAGNGTVTLLHSAPASGRTATLSCNLASIHFGSTSLSFGSGVSAANFTYSADPVTVSQTGSVTVTMDSGAKLSKGITVNPTSNLSTFTVDNSSPFMTYQINGTVTYSQPVTTNTTLKVTASDGYVKAVAPPTVLANGTSANFTMNTGVLPTLSTHQTMVTVSDSGKSLTTTITIQPIYMISALPTSITLHSNQTGSFTVNLSRPAGAYTIHPAVTCADGNVAVPVQINFGSGVQSTVLQVKTGTITTTSSATITIGPLCNAMKQVTVNYSP